MDTPHLTSLSFPGQCPLPDCLYLEAHEHRICGSCQALGWSNPHRCGECLLHAPERAKAIERSQLWWRVNKGGRN